MKSEELRGINRYTQIIRRDVACNVSFFEYFVL